LDQIGKESQKSYRPNRSRSVAQQVVRRPFWLGQSSYGCQKFGPPVGADSDDVVGRHEFDPE